MNFHSLNMIFITINVLFECNFCLKVRMPSIFGRRMSQNDTNLRSALELSNIVPDVIDTVPLNKVQVRYPNGIDVDLGNELTPKSVKDQPSVEWPTDVGQYYTIMMTDPDAPSREKPTKREIKHWLIINIPGTDLTKGETLAVYRGPSPSNGTGIHRYVFIVYRQLGLVTHSEKVLTNSSREGRAHFNGRVFAKNYNLGEPVATNFFVSQYDEYVGLMRSKSRNRPKVQAIGDSRPIQPRRAQVLDWAPRKPKSAKFPQMICINYERYERIQKLIKDSKEENKID